MKKGLEIHAKIYLLIIGLALSACVGQGGPSSLDSGREGAEQDSGATVALIDEALNDDGGSGNNNGPTGLEANSPGGNVEVTPGTDPNEGNTGSISPGVFQAQPLNTAVIGQLTSLNEPMNLSEFCQSNYDDCMDAADNTYLQIECGNQYTQCKDIRNCSSKKALCLANGKPIVECSAEADRCLFENECLDLKDECNSDNQASGECNGFYQSCLNAIDGKIAQCKDDRNRCKSLGGNSQLCESGYNNCMTP